MVAPNLWKQGVAYADKAEVIQYATTCPSIYMDFVIGIPLPFVVIGLGSLYNQYGVKDSRGELQ